MTRRKPEQYNWDQIEFDETILDKHFTSPRRGKISFVIVHHMTIIGDGSGRALTGCWNTWQRREASAQYGVEENLVRQFVWDRDAAWATGNSSGNHSGISIEHANSKAGPSWTISERTWKTGARLAAYLHKVYKLGRPTSTSGGRGGTLRKHSSFTATACPGPYMDSIWGQYVAEAQRVYDQITKTSPTVPPVAEPPKPSEPKPPVVEGTVHHIMSYNPSDKMGQTAARARQVVAAAYAGSHVPDVIAFQELTGRVKEGDRSAWADAVLAELQKRGRWWMSVPTTGFNENHVAVNLDTCDAAKNHDDYVIRTSGAGGRHCTKVSYVKGGKRILVGNVHLDDKASDAAVDRQAKAALDNIKASVGKSLKIADEPGSVVIDDCVLLGDFNKETWPAAAKSTGNFHEVGSRAKKLINWAYSTFGGTSATWRKGRHIDWIGVHHTEVVEYAEVIRYKGTPVHGDHFPVLAGVTFR